MLHGTVGVACCRASCGHGAASESERRTTMMSTRRRRELFTGVSFLAVVAALGAVATMLEYGAAAQSKAAGQAPMFEVDPLWPKPLPNNWTLGNGIGIAVDSNDHVWMIHRTGGVPDNFKLAGATNCPRTPPAFGVHQAGKLVCRWGGPAAGEE